MGLSQSLYTGWTGLATHQKSMDNLSHNLANVNTVGYKKTDFLFSSLMKKSLTTGGIPADGDRSALNPKNLGLGTTTGAILHNFTGGTIDQTDNPLDCALDGNGFFMVNTSRGTALTRDGGFFLDNLGADGLRGLCMGVGGNPVQGWNAVNGTVAPGGAVENIRIPAIGDFMPGERTRNASFVGLLPSNTGTADFDGAETARLELTGNLPGSGSIETSMYVGMDQTDGTNSTMNGEIREVKVRIDFTGGGANGDTNDFAWTMTTVDWPNPGDPGVQIYPPADDPEFVQSTISFYNQGNAELGAGLGEPVEDVISTGASDVRTTITDGNGNAVTTSFRIPADFTLDVSHMTNMAAPPVDPGLGVWFVDGNPAGTMRRTMNVFDETVTFEPFTDANGVTTMQAVRSIEARQNSLIFEQTERTDTGSTWSWTSSAGGSGTLDFNTDGELTRQTQSGGGINYDFGEIGTAGQAGALQLSSQDGFRDGVLEEVSIDRNGRIFGSYTNDLTELLAQLAVATVPNNNGLYGTGGNLFYPNPAVSGEVRIGTANGDNGAGQIMSGALESSNVRLAQEFTNMISIERGYQFNSRVVTTSDEMLQTALQLIP